jgi:NTP pyrophosphatase (non-canonical NTP hydrolase)
MGFNTYQKNAEKTINKEITSSRELILNACLGLAGEAGEVIDHVKKWAYQGHELSKEKIIDELGDVLWYMSEMCTALDIKFAQVSNYNTRKLKRRYGDKFSKEQSINRKE